MLKHTVHRSRQLSAESIAKNLQTSCGLQISTTVCRASWNGFPWPSSCFQALHHLTSSAMQSIGCSGVKHTATGLWSDESRFWLAIR
ncbi:unnamed protein product [Staurois parvus]|uniref:Uncharacterized protein n=1 Tax=Staurois parvus TaxID=386267 RepID=A0ABN9DFP8_9NEOB|nr:unnamed protein product [Staurois parvus]